MNKGLIAVILIQVLANSGFSDDSNEPKIAWYGTLQSGLAEAERSQKPILLVSAAPQCLGVSGIW